MKLRWPSRKTWLRIGGFSLLKSALILAIIMATSAQAGTPLLITDAAHKPRATYHVEIARTPAQHEKGLMFRKTLEPGSGMLFLFDPPRNVRMWMKDTYISLDMIFADAGGRVIYIQRNAKPHDLTSLGPDRSDVASVLEIPAGEADKAGIALGDRIAIQDKAR